MVKFFTYLTDVADGTGPHVYIAGSHRDKPPLFAPRYSDEKLAKKYGEKAFISIEGRRGTMFLADTFGVHKGRPRCQAHALCWRSAIRCYRAMPSTTIR